MKRVLLSALAALLPVAAHAAGSVRLLAWDEEVAARQLALVAGESSAPIAGLHPLKRSAVFRVKADTPVRIRALDKPAAADGKPVEIGCPIPESMKLPLLVLMPDGAHPTGIRPLVIDDNPANFRWGSYRFFNSTKKELVVQLERRAVRVPAGWKPVDVDLGGENRGFGVRIALSEAIEKPLYSSVWEYDPNTRLLVFLVPGTDPRLGPVAFKAIPEDQRTLALDSRAAGGGEEKTPDKPSANP